VEAQGKEPAQAKLSAKVETPVKVELNKTETKPKEEIKTAVKKE